MTIKQKIYLLMGIYLLGFIAFSASVWISLQKNSQVQECREQGYLLLRQSAEVKSLMKDIVFDLFAPQMYKQTRSLTYSPSSRFTLDQWEESINEYKNQFDFFMQTAEFLQKGDRNIQEQFFTARVMSQKAEEKLNNLTKQVSTVRTRYANENNIYNAMQKDASLNLFFNDFQETYFYFSNSFDSFMNYLIFSLKDEGEKLNQHRLVMLLVILALFALIALGFTSWLARDINRKINKLQNAFKNLGYGNFSIDYTIPGKDEFSGLSSDLNRLVSSLKENINNILNLSRDVASFISENSDLGQLLDLISYAVLQDTSSDAVMFHTLNRKGPPKLESAAGTEILDADKELLEKNLISKVIRPGGYLLYRKGDSGFSETFKQIQSFLAIPVIMEGKPFGILTAIKTPEMSYFSDLGVTRLTSFAEYVSLTIDHYFKYSELLERREARYQALHSQLQPHFIYNILGGLQGLNRKGDRDGLSETIDALKRMLRYIQSSNKWTVLEDEIVFIRKYCQLQKIRFGDRINFRIEMDNSCSHIQIPRLLLQPIVENSIIHGLEPLEAGGTLNLSVKSLRHNGEMGAMILIEDDGAGFDTDKLERTCNIGIQNVQERLVVHHPGSHFRIDSSPGKGTRVEIII